MKMTLNETIEHARELANTIECKECANEHQQLANFLVELKLLREQFTEFTGNDYCLDLEADDVR